MRIMLLQPAVVLLALFMGVQDGYELANGKPRSSMGRDLPIAEFAVEGSPESVCTTGRVVRRTREAGGFVSYRIVSLNAGRGWVVTTVPGSLLDAAIGDVVRLCGRRRMRMIETQTASVIERAWRR